MNYALLKTRELQVVVGNNEPGCGEFESHRQGYNGIWSMTSIHNRSNCFVPFYAGLNLEHLMDDLFMTDQGGDAYEPRQAPMQLTRVKDAGVCLKQAPTPQTGVESETLFQPIEPNAVDMSFKARLHHPPRAGKWFGFFWASYLNAPECPALYFRDQRGFLQCLSPETHGAGGANTVCHASIVQPQLGTIEGQYAAHSLAHSYNKRKFGPPMMFGRPADGSMLFLQMFDQCEAVRLCMSPSGGGADKSKMTYNPAWDFQYIIDDARPDTEYHLRSRLVYKPYESLQEIETIYTDWLTSDL